MTTGGGSDADGAAAPSAPVSSEPESSVPPSALPGSSTKVPPTVMAATVEPRRRSMAAPLFAVGVTLFLIVSLGVAILVFSRSGGDDGELAGSRDTAPAERDGTSPENLDADASNPTSSAPPDTSPIAVAVEATTTSTTTTSTTVAPVTLPPATIPPAAIPAPTSPVAAPPDAPYVWPFGEFFSVGQYGSEPVRGTGCGGNSEIDEIIPDGVWHGVVTRLDPVALDLDLYCIYHGESSAEFIAEFVAEGGNLNAARGGYDWWPVSNSDRTRRVPLSPTFVHRNAAWTDQGCFDPGPLYDNPPDLPYPYDGFTNWIVIEDGRAVFMLTSCPL